MSIVSPADETRASDLNRQLRSTAPQRVRSNLTVPLVLVCFVLSGVSSLTLQTAWTQQLALVFGASGLAVAAVLAAYMAGLTVGAAAAGRGVHRLRRPLLVYALLELGIGLSALAVPWLIRIAKHLQMTVLGNAAAPPEAGSLGTVLFQLAVAFGVLAAPTVMMGATLPILVRWSVRKDGDIGPRVGLLYTANTLGAAAGAGLGAFVLLPQLGLNATVLVAAAINGFVCLTALLLLRMRQPVPASPCSEPARDETWSPTTNRWVLLAVTISGFTSFTYEVMWTRLLMHMLGDTVYAFGTMLATFLSGIALGAAVGARLARDQAQSRALFAVIQVSIGVSSWLALITLDHLPQWLPTTSGIGIGTLHAAGLSTVVLFPGALFVGASFPVAVRILAPRAEVAGRASAMAFTWNTIGAIAGAIAAGFFLLPTFGFAATTAIAVLLNLTLAMMAALLRPRLRIHVAFVAIAVASLAMWPPETPWEVLRQRPLSGSRATGNVAFFAVGRSATVLVSEERGDWRLSTNGLPEASIQPRGSRVGRYPLTQWLGVLPFALRPQAETVLVVGLGAGLTVRAIPPSAQKIHVVEIEPEVVRANRRFSEHRLHDPLSDPRVRLIVNDARSGLQLSRQRYDVIISQPSHPWTTGSSHLFSREFFAQARDRLTADGLLMQWIGLEFTDAGLLRSILATMSDVFPTLEVYSPAHHNALLLVGANGAIDLEASASKGFDLAASTWRANGVLSVNQILVTRLLDDAGAHHLAAGAPLIRDGRNLLMIDGPRALHSPLEGNQLVDLVGEHDAVHRLVNREDGVRLVARLAAEQSVARARRAAQAIRNPREREIAHALVDIGSGRHRSGGRRLLTALAENPRHREALHGLVQMAPSWPPHQPLPKALQHALRNDPQAAAVVEGWRLVQQHRPEKVRDLELRLVAIEEDDILWRTATTLRILWREAQHDPALAGEAIELLEPQLIYHRRLDLGLLLRARLAVTARRHDIVLASLAELLERPSTSHHVVRLAHAAQDILDQLPADCCNDPQWLRVHESIRKHRNRPSM